MNKSYVKPRLRRQLEHEEFIPFHRPSLGEAEEKAVLDVMRSGWLARGAKTSEFERLFAEHVGTNNAIALNSCTAALHLALLVTGIGPGDEVITTPFTFAATANTILHVGAKPVFADIEYETMNINPDHITALISKRTRAIMPVHFGGYPCNMDEIGAIAEDFGLTVIEDAAHAFGTEFDGRKIGSLSPFTAFSFYATKNITTGEGGMLTVHDPGMAKQARILSLHGMSADAWKRYNREGHSYYEVIEPGYKYNMFDLQAALGVEQLKHAESMRERRRGLSAIYDSELADFPLITLPRFSERHKHAHHLYVVLLDIDALEVERDTIAATMESLNVSVSVHFRSLHLHSYYRDRFGFKPEDFPVATLASEQELSLPLFPEMKDEDAIHVATTLKDVLDYYASHS